MRAFVSGLDHQLWYSVLPDGDMYFLPREILPNAGQNYIYLLLDCIPLSGRTKPIKTMGFLMVSIKNSFVVQ